MKKTTRRNPFQRVLNVLLLVGPGIFCAGYTIGTGSVTSMAKSGSQFGMRLLWVLLLSCVFSWVLMEAYGRYAVVTGETALFSFKTHLKWGPGIAILTLAGVIIGQWTALAGLVGLTSSLIYETLQLFFPLLVADKYWTTIAIAAAILLFFYALLWVGKYSFFEKVVFFFVTLMAAGFLTCLFVVFPSPVEIARGLVPSVPRVNGATLMVAAFVGTTMAAPTFVVRPLLMRGKGWTAAHTREQGRDSFVSALAMFVISGSVMAAATAVLFHQGRPINNVLDMVATLEPVAGRFALLLFLAGTLSAGFSSIFPVTMVAPLLIADYRDGRLETRSRLFRVLAVPACLAGLSVPVFGGNPIAAQIATQVAQVFVLPVVILGIVFLVNNEEMMGASKAGPLLNLGLAAAFVFACIISVTGIFAIMDFFKGSF